MLPWVALRFTPNQAYRLWLEHCEESPVDITGDHAYLNILDPSGALKSHELTVLKAWLKQHHKRAFADAATQALLASHEA